MIENTQKRRLYASLTLALLTTSGCTHGSGTDDILNMTNTHGYQAHVKAASKGNKNKKRAVKFNVSSQYKACTTPFPASAVNTANIPMGDAELLSIGDLLQISVIDDETFTGQFEVSQDGSLKLPHLPPIRANGNSAKYLERRIAKNLMEKGFYVTKPNVSVRVVDFASARVFVSGAVFEPGTISIGAVSSTDRDAQRQAAPGGTADGRRLSRALQSSGGIRPDADLSNIKIIRGGKTINIDARPAMEGKYYQDIILLSGDRVEVASRGCFQDKLVKPAALTRPGIKIIATNQTKTTGGTPIGKDKRELRYGTRLSQAVTSINCVGGAKLTNARRSAILITRNPITQEPFIFETNVEDLIRNQNRDYADPFIMPGDALACYDSTSVDAFEIISGLGGLGLMVLSAMAK